MAMTAAVKDELARLKVTKPCCRKAEVSAMLRFAGGLHIVGGRIVIEAELDTGAAARRLRKDIAEVFGHSSEMIVVAPRRAAQGQPLHRAGRQGRRAAGAADRAARRRGRPVRGLPPQVVNGSLCDAEAAWRGAFLAHGSLTEPGRSSALEVTCPGPEAALALVGAARRLGIAAKAREVRGVDRVVIRDGDAIAALLTRLGAHDAVLAWEERRMRREVRATANRLANFDDANLRRSARAAVAAGARVQRALEILGDEVPDHLAEAGKLRIEHQQASLEELGALADPPMTKDAIAGRIRRLLAMADKRAGELGHPGHRGRHSARPASTLMSLAGPPAAVEPPERPDATCGAVRGGTVADTSRAAASADRPIGDGLPRRHADVPRDRGVRVTAGVGINGFDRIGRNCSCGASTVRRIGRNFSAPRGARRSRSSPSTT